MTLKFSYKGIAIAIGIISIWFGAMIFVLKANIAIITLLPALTVLIFLYTGLFITAHDAMHGTIAPKHPRINAFIGICCVLLYALFSFKKLRKQHRLHHANPAAENDPDYHDGYHTGFWLWYLNFLLRYVTIYQLIGMAIAFNILHHVFEIALERLLVFWVLPSLLSTLQLFYFGTYLPHRKPDGGYDNRHRARSNNYPSWLSFLTCYHFGYHWEHHEQPNVPWWLLPTLHDHYLKNFKPSYRRQSIQRTN